jgi:hypothetical protein
MYIQCCTYARDPRFYFQVKTGTSMEPNEVSSLQQLPCCIAAIGDIVPVTPGPSKYTICHHDCTEIMT